MDSASVGQPTPIGRTIRGDRPSSRQDGSGAVAAGTLTRTVPTAVIAFDFDPFLHVGDGVVRWETLGIALAIFAALVIAAIGTRSLELRVDDLIFVVLGIVPGAVIGGRLGYVLLHPAFFIANPGAILDPGIGSLQLSLGVIGGSLTGGAVAGSTLSLASSRSTLT